MPKIHKTILVTFNTEFIIPQATQAELACGQMLEDRHTEGTLTLSAAALPKVSPSPDSLQIMGSTPALHTLGIPLGKALGKYEH